VIIYVNNGHDNISEHVIKLEENTDRWIEEDLVAKILELHKSKKSM